MASNFSSIIQMCKAGLSDEDAKCQSAAFVTLGTAIGTITDDSHSKTVVDVLPTMFQVELFPPAAGF